MGSEIILGYSNPFVISLYIVSSVTVVLEIYGLFSIHKSYKNFCFEKYVLISGLIELCLIVLEISLPDDILLKDETILKLKNMEKDKKQKILEEKKKKKEEQQQKNKDEKEERKEEEEEKEDDKKEGISDNSMGS